MQEENKKTHKFINFILFIILVLSLLFLYAKYIGIKGLIVKEYRIESDILTNNFSGFKIVHISDILYGGTVDKEDLDNLVSKVNILKPDIIVFTGNLVHRSKNIKEDDIEVLSDTFNNMKASVGKYAIKGNYDYNDYYEDILSNSDFIYLENSYDKIYYKNNEYIYIVGIPSLNKGDIDIDKAFEFYSDENRKYIISLVHEGNTISKIEDTTYEVDLILGGHSLNGSVIIPYYGPLFIPKDSNSYYAPKYSRGISEIFISSGIGTDEYPYRFLNKPSINLIRLKSNN